jgi:hypothetical protein
MSEMCPWCGQSDTHYMTHICKGCECSHAERRIPGEPHMPAYYDAEPNPDCLVHFPVGQVLTKPQEGEQ